MTEFGTDPVDEDITDDLTIDGADLLAELQAAHARQAAGDPDELTIDGVRLLEQITSGGGFETAAAAAPAQASAHETRLEHASEATLARWSPPPTMAEPEEIADHRSGRPNRVQLLVIAVVVVISLVVGGWLMRGVLAAADEPVAPINSDAPSQQPYVRGFGT